MKDYEHIVIWLDYFNKTLPRKMGRKVSRGKSVFDPSLKELVDAAKLAGLQPSETNDSVRFPRRPFVRSGYVIFPKGEPKSKIISLISEKLVLKRSKQSK